VLASPMDTPNLLASFGIDLTVRTIALIGGGGKTTLMYALAREMVRQGHAVVTTTTTRIFPPAPDQSPHLILLDDDPHLDSLSMGLSRFHHVTVGRRVSPSTGKVEGVSEQSCKVFLQAAQWVVVEADGAAGKPIKAPEAWEPVIPATTDLLIPVVGLDCLAQPASETRVFRLKRFLELTGLREGELIGPEHIAVAVAHAGGGLKGAPERSIVVPFLNKTDLLSDSDALQRMVQGIFHRTRTVRTVVTGCLNEEAIRVKRWAGNLSL
jgi:probable selenium-dependent hydroxylase accessory protein YqeC